MFLYALVLLLLQFQCEKLLMLTDALSPSCSAVICGLTWLMCFSHSSPDNSSLENKMPQKHRSGFCEDLILMQKLILFFFVVFFRRELAAASLLMLVFTFLYINLKSMFLICL